MKTATEARREIRHRPSLPHAQPRNSRRQVSLDVRITQTRGASGGIARSQGAASDQPAADPCTSGTCAVMYPPGILECPTASTYAGEGYDSVSDVHPITAAMHLIKTLRPQGRGFECLLRHRGLRLAVTPITPASAGSSAIESLRILRLTEPAARSASMAEPPTARARRAARGSSSAAAARSSTPTRCPTRAARTCAYVDSRSTSRQPWA